MPKFGPLVSLLKDATLERLRRDSSTNGCGGVQGQNAGRAEIVQRRQAIAATCRPEWPTGDEVRATRDEIAQRLADLLAEL